MNDEFLQNASETLNFTFEKTAQEVQDLFNNGAEKALKAGDIASALYRPPEWIGSNVNKFYHHFMRS